MSGTTSPLSPFNVGSDTAVVIISNGTVLASSILVSFDYKQMTTRLKAVAINGVNNYRELEEGWDGTFEYDKADDVIDAFFANKEALRYAGAYPPHATITQTDTNADGSNAVYSFDGCTFRLEEGGRRQGDGKVTQRVTWAASRRYKVV